ncbi:MAG: HRDC domain-containing protein [Proteobacteria bacterium]|nr:HRDC domain-containing protein [Pseudomonadota bacterium]
MNLPGKKLVFIDKMEDLAVFVPDFEGSSRLAVDLEADSMYHFKEKVCLVQIANQNTTIVIDTLKIKNLNCLKPLFANPELEKVFHGSDYDVRSLYRDFKIDIHNLFDTELASRFLGVRETGLGAVLLNRFSVSLDKKFQKKDWSQRPLPKGMIEYGAKDVTYLLPLADILKEELIEKDRLAWVLEECEYQSRVRASSTDNEQLFLKVRGAGRLDRKSLAVLEQLLHYRLSKASKMNRPPFKIIGNAGLLELAINKPVTMESLLKTNILSSRQIEIYAQGMIQSIKRAMKMPEEKLPRYPHKRMPRLKPSVTKQIEAIKKWRDQTAEKLDLDPSLLLNKAIINDIAMRHPVNPEELENINGLKNWQKQVFGEDIVRILKA